MAAVISTKISDKYRHVNFNNWLYKLASPLYALWFEKSSSYICKKNNLSKMAEEYLIKVRWSRFLANKFLAEKKYLSHTSIDSHNIKKSDTLYIIGTGGSINDISNDEWNEIKKHDSIGLNFFFIHDFKPTLYMVELNHTSLMIDLMEKKLFNVTNETPVYVNIQHVLRCSSYEKVFSIDNAIKPNAFYYSPAYCLLPQDEVLCAEIAPLLLRTYYHKWLLNNSSNLDTAICMAYQRGYKNIKLVGVDLDNNKYFWDAPSGGCYLKENYILARAAFEMARDNNQKTEGFHLKEDVHLTEDKEHLKKFNKISISEYLRLVCKHVLEKENIKLTVCNPKSKLATVIPYTPIV